MGKKLGKQGLVKLARGSLEEFRRVVSDAPEPLVRDVIDDLEEVELYAAAELCYRELIWRDPEDEESYRWLGLNLYHHQRDPERAEELLLEASDKFPENTEIALTRATNLSWGMQRHRDALPIFHEIVRRAPDNAVYRCVLGWCLLWLGERRAGLCEIEASLQCKQDQDDEVRLANHVYLYLLGGSVRRDEALAMCRTLVRTGVEVEDWDFGSLVRQAREAKHPETQWLDRFIAVISGEQDESELEGWSAWEAAYRPPAAFLALARLNALEQAPARTSKLQIPARRDYWARYQAGEYQVWDELLHHAPFVTQDAGCMEEARAVAEALMRRVRQNVDAVRATLSESGAELADEQPPPSAEDLKQLEAGTGPLPLSLAALWTVVGSIDLRPPHPSYDYGACSLQDQGISLIALDPLCFEGLDVDSLIETYVDDLDEDDGDDAEQAEAASPDDEAEEDADCQPLIVRFAPDFLHKQNVSGGPPYSIELPPMTRYDVIDPDLIHEWHDTTLVGYLRACFEYSGFPLLRVARQPIETIALNHRIAFKNVKGPWGPAAERLIRRLSRQIIPF